MSGGSHWETWDAYSRTWATTDSDKRRAAFDRFLGAGCVYRDPLVTLKGHDALQAYMEDFNTRFPGAGFRTTPFIAHHGRSIAHWNMVGADGEILDSGVSFGVYGEEGELLEMNGFFEVPPQP